MTNDIKIIELVSVFCPACGHKFDHKKRAPGKIVGFWGGALVGAKAGAGIGIVGGPIGAIAGTIPGAIVGAIFGRKLGGAITDADPKCPKCTTAFKMP
jgi:hypothetical protein